MIGKFNVLLVDDDPDKRALLAVALEMDGYHVHTANDGEAGLAAVESYQPDLIITDVMMPKMDGYDLARRVRANPLTRFIPIIIQTAARNDAQDQRRGAEVGALGYITDPTDLDLLLARARTLLDFKSYLDTVEEAAHTDHLTGLANRRRFERQLDREVARALRYDRPFCLLLLDIDFFKNVNDTYGHDAGDEAIRQLAKVLQAGTRGIDTAARIGGEEFAIILTETEFEGGCEVAERLRVAIKAAEIPLVGHITASFGVAEFPLLAQTVRELMSVTDAALYEAKRQGRDRIMHAAESGANSPPALDVVQ
ncbi:MAG: diguanylate cyclase [Pyrinomonadaceae bacterium]